MRRIWYALGPGTNRGSVTYWGFQALALIVAAVVLANDGKWWFPPAVAPFVALSLYHTRKAARRRQFF
jgi:hypothetical protein